jgi:hypothetical protein
MNLPAFLGKTKALRAVYAEVFENPVFLNLAQRRSGAIQGGFACFASCHGPMCSRAPSTRCTGIAGEHTNCARSPKKKPAFAG